MLRLYFILYFRLFLLTLPFHNLFESTYTATEVEDYYETEIDPRLPSEFPAYKLLRTRVNGFNEIIHYDYASDTKTTIEVRNWELFANG